MRFLLFICLAARAESLRVVVTDPSGAVVPNASVQVRGPATRQAKTGATGEYAFPALPSGRYEIRLNAKGFTPATRALDLRGDMVLDVRLTVRGERTSVTVDDGSGRIGLDAESNAGTLRLRQRLLAALSDDPDELALQLQALAGPAPGPDGGEMFVDGFSGGRIPPKSSIREVRINSNPFSPEYDRPGFSRVEIFTKPGSEAFHGEGYAQLNDRVLNGRNPLLTASTRPPYRVQSYGVDLGGPLRKERTSFTVAAERRQIDENALVQATTLDGPVNFAVETPQTRTSIAPRLDFALGRSNTLALRYQELRAGYDNQGVGDYSLPSRAYREGQADHVLQLTETAIVSPRLLNETRVQAAHASTRYLAASDAPAIDVVGAFSAGGAPIGNSSTWTDAVEMTNVTSWRGWKWGARVRTAALDDVSLRNFNGTFTFYTLDQYRKDILSQATRTSGTPETRVRQTDVGFFAGKDWKIRPTWTASFGLRYEAQTNLGNLTGWAPRVGVAWKATEKTVVRAGAGAFYDRLPNTLTLNALRFDGLTQIATVDGAPLLRPVSSSITAPRLWQGSVAVERQLNRSSKISATWIASRGTHLLNVRNVNTPITGTYPVRLLQESAGFSRIQQLVVNLNTTHVFGYYALSQGQDDNEGLPANPYNLRAEWGPSTYADVRHRLVVGASLPLPGRWMVAPFVAINSGVPYNITTGLDPLRTGAPTARPDGVGRNSARADGNANLALRVSRTWRHLTLSASTMNALNHPNFAPPVGNLSSPYFGQPRALGGLIVMQHGGAPTSYNRKIDLQLRLTF